MVTQCPSCKAKFKAPDDWKGKVTKCPRCQQPFTVVEIVAGPKPKPVSRPKPAPAAAPVQRKPAPAPQPAYEKAQTEELSDTVYVYSVICALAISAFSLVSGQRCCREGGREFVIFGGILIAMGVVLGIYSTVVRFMLYYKMWAAIQDDEARISPGKAIGFLFVPLLNIFWAVYMFVGFAKDYNDFADRHSIATERLSKGLFLQYAILWIFLDISFVVLFMLPALGYGRELFGVVYASFGSGGNFRYVVMLWKMSNVACAIWLFTIYAILSTRICRAINAI
jgi:predicted Zn finger-like uncharacterized protein